MRTGGWRLQLRTKPAKMERKQAERGCAVCVQALPLTGVGAHSWGGPGPFRSHWDEVWVKSDSIRIRKQSAKQ